MLLEEDVTRLRLDEPLVRWDSYSAPSGQYLRGVLRHTPFSNPGSLSHVVLSQFHLLLKVVHLVSAVFVFFCSQHVCCFWELMRTHVVWLKVVL